MVMVGGHHSSGSPVHVTVTNRCVVRRLREAARHEVPRVLKDADTLRNHGHVEGLAPSDGNLSVKSFRLILLTVELRS